MSLAERGPASAPDRYFFHLVTRDGGRFPAQCFQPLLDLPAVVFMRSSLACAMTCMEGSFRTLPAIIMDKNAMSSVPTRASDRRCRFTIASGGGARGSGAAGAGPS